MGVLDNLKIPRGDRSDWAAKEYLLIDSVSINKTEIDNAKEGYSSLLENLNTKYASKAYVQLAIGNPNPSEIVISDIGISPSDVGKVGYTLQINNAGTGLVFANTYKLGNGDLTNPALAFGSGVSAGIYCSYAAGTETIHFKLNGASIANLTVNTTTDVVTMNIGSVAISSNGVISTNGNITTTADVSATNVSATNVTATGTSSSFAEMYATILGAGTANLGALSVSGLSSIYGISRNLSTSLLNAVNISFIFSTTRDYFCTSCPGTPQDGGNTDGYLQVIAGVGSETGKAIHIFFGVNRKISINYYNGSSWAGWKTLANDTGNINNRFTVAAATDATDAMQKTQVEQAITDAFSAYTPPSVVNGYVFDYTTSVIWGTTSELGTIVPATIVAENSVQTFTLPAKKAAMVHLVGPGGMCGGAGFVPNNSDGTIVGTYLSFTSNPSLGNNVISAPPGYTAPSNVSWPDGEVAYVDFRGINGFDRFYTYRDDTPTGVFIRQMTPGRAIQGPVQPLSYSLSYVDGFAGMGGYGKGGAAATTTGVRGGAAGPGGVVIALIENTTNSALTVYVKIGKAPQSSNLANGAMNPTHGAFAYCISS